jgi:hypothetical protein
MRSIFLPPLPSWEGGNIGYGKCEEERGKIKKMKMLTA